MAALLFWRVRTGGSLNGWGQVEWKMGTRSRVKVSELLERESEREREERERVSEREGGERGRYIYRKKRE